ncbi:MAG: molecular chaperone TorD family protein [Betaproteobacteria bacterium]|nr:molecular chaperone TorD family protein [Betaproteobacteria bacterium]
MSPPSESTASEEDRARANFYALLSRLLHAGPDAALLASIAASEQVLEGEEGPPLAEAWRVLARVCADADAAAVQQEYTEIFVGIGQAPVTPYCSHYLVESGTEKVLVGLREELAGLGLARVPSASEPEDHIAALLEIMRHLLLSGGGDDARQRAVFERYLEPAYPRFCEAVGRCPEARFYAIVVRVLREFLDVETEALRMA